MTLYSLLAPPATPVPSIGQGIRFNDRLFTEPRRLGMGLIAPAQGIYVILIQDIRWSPRQLRPIYFGESEDLRKRVCDLHEKHSDWKREAGILDLFYAYHPTLGYTAQQRKDAEWALIHKYDTPCNIQLRPFSGLGSLLGSK